MTPSVCHVGSLTILHVPGQEDNMIGCGLNRCMMTGCRGRGIGEALLVGVYSFLSVPSEWLRKRRAIRKDTWRKKRHG